MFLLFAIALLSTLSNADGTYKWVQVGADIDGEAAYDQSGTSVSMSADGSIVAIGAANNMGNGNNAGHVRVYENQSDSWVQLGEDIEGDTNYAFASKVSMNAAGSILSVSARHGEDPGDYSGKLRVYKNQSGSWVQVGEDFNGEEYYDRVGQSSSFSDTGSILAIGANGKDGNGVRVYENQSDSWVQLGAVIDGEEALDRSGESVSISSDGSRVAIGAIYNGENAGHVRVYEFQSENWVQLGADIDGEAANDYSGRSVLISADGSRVAIGAAYNDGNGWRSGHVRIYEFQASSWVQLGADIDGEAALDNSGSSVSMSADGSVVAIGAQINEGVNGEKSGHVRVFEFQEGNWVQLGADIDGEARSDESGGSITLSADGFVIAIGAYANNGNGDDSGHVRVYKRELVAPTPSPTKSPTPSPSNLPTTSPTISPSISPTTSPTASPTTDPTPDPTCTGYIKRRPAASTTRISGGCSGGFIPSEIEELTALTYLRLSSNQLTGSIPDSISALTALNYIYLNSNQLTGTIPDSISALTRLTTLYFHANQLTGTIPDSISTMTALQYIQLYENLLTGTIPDSISTMTALKYLQIQKNQLTGTIPDSISTMTALSRLYLSDNQLTGSVPDSFSGLTRLQLLYLAGNDLCVSTNINYNFWYSIYYNDASESNYAICAPDPTPSPTADPTTDPTPSPTSSPTAAMFEYEAFPGYQCAGKPAMRIGAGMQISIEEWPRATDVEACLIACSNNNMCTGVAVYNYKCYLRTGYVFKKSKAKRTCYEKKITDTYKEDVCTKVAENYLCDSDTCDARIGEYATKYCNVFASKRKIWGQVCETDCTGKVTTYSTKADAEHMRCEKSYNFSHTVRMTFGECKKACNEDSTCTMFEMRQFVCRLFNGGSRKAIPVDMQKKEPRTTYCYKIIQRFVGQF